MPLQKDLFALLPAREVVRERGRASQVANASSWRVDWIAHDFQVRVVHNVTGVVVHRVRLQRLVHFNALVLIRVRHSHRVVALLVRAGPVEMLRNLRGKVRVCHMRVLQMHWRHERTETASVLAALDACLAVWGDL